MIEEELKGELVAKIRFEEPEWVTLRHEDLFTSGVPDMSTTGGKATVWMEIKHANPRIRGRKIQERTAIVLARQGYCFYLVYYERMYQRTNERRTLIIEPRHIKNFPLCPAVLWTKGFDHFFVVKFLRGIHRDYNKS